MFFADNQSNESHEHHHHKIESDLYLFDQLSSVAHQPDSPHPPPPYTHPLTCLPIDGPEELRPFTLQALEDQIQNQPEPTLFYRLSEDFKDENLSENDESQRRLRARIQNDTKNIPKNFGKGIINFVQKNEKLVRRIVSSDGIMYGDFMRQVRSRKQTLNTIAQLRRLWTDQKIGRSMRIISNLFFRKYALSYIFNSRICSYSTHIKYRQALWEALNNPHEFNHIKKY